MIFRDIAKFDRAVAGRLVVSCQPVDEGPMDSDAIVLQLAQAGILGGAGAVRIEGVARVKLVAANRALTNVPIIGIVKRDLADSPVRITPFAQDVRDLIAAGADVVAVDATERTRPDSVATLLGAIRQGGALAMADCSNITDAINAHKLGFDIIGTTLSGYVGDKNSPPPVDPDYDLIAALSQIPGIKRIMAEGRIHTPSQAAKAKQHGAWAVTVGTAITRTEVITQWFAGALANP